MRQGRRLRRMPGRIRATALAGLLLALLAVGACSADSGAAGGQLDSAAREAAPPAPDRDSGRAGSEEAEASDEAGQDSGRSGATQEVSATDLPPVHLVRTASLTVLTGDVAGQYAEAVSLTERAGGFVSGETTDQDAEGRQRSRVTLRVPPERYAGLLRDISALGKLHTREVSTEDVTGEVVDVDSRIGTQEESVARVRALMSEATSLSEVVSLESELSRRQADLEALKAQQKSLRERTGMATVTLELREPEPKTAEEDKEEEPSGPSVGGAFVGGWNAFLTALLWVGVVIGAVLPFTATAALLFVAWHLLRKRLPTAPSATDQPAPLSSGKDEAAS